MIPNSISIKDHFKNFNIYIVLILLLCLINIIYKLNITLTGISIKVNLWNPTWLLFGPFLLYGLTELTRRRISRLKMTIHLLPCIFFSAYFIYIQKNINPADPWSSNDFILYQNSYYLVAISLLSYSTYCLINCSKISVDLFPRIQPIIISIGTFFSISAIILIMMYLAWGIIHLDTIIDYRYFNYGILFLIAILLSRYLLIDRPIIHKHLQKKIIKDSNTGFSYTDKNMNLYQEKVTTYFNNSKVFLKPTLNLETISKNLNIPKNTLSYLFNSHLNTNFHTFVAEFRINYAIDLMKDLNNNYTIESLANFSGFNSKSSFNKHFRERTGVSPSEYQAQLKYSRDTI